MMTVVATHRLIEPVAVQTWSAPVPMGVLRNILTTCGTVKAQVTSWACVQDVVRIVTPRGWVISVNTWWLGLVISILTAASQTALASVCDRFPRVLGVVWIQVLHVRCFLLGQSGLRALDPLEILITTGCIVIWNNTTAID